MIYKFFLNSENLNKSFKKSKIKIIENRESKIKANKITNLFQWNDEKYFEFLFK